MNYSAYVFDAYGTLFDVHSAVRAHAGEIGPSGQAFSELWRNKQLEYSWVHTLTGNYLDFWTLTEQSLDFAFEKFPEIDRTLRASLLDAYWHLDCYEEVASVLAALKAGGAKLAILSNGTPAMLEAAVRSSALESFFDEVFSAETVKRFKTDRSVYEIVTNHWRIYPEAVSFQSSNRWDIAGAVQFGFRTVWINRTGQPDEYKESPPGLILPSLGGLVR